MIPKEESFKLNELLYTLIKRNDVVGIFGIGGTYTDKPINWEVCRFYIRKEDKYRKYVKEAITNNFLFGFDGSRCFNGRDYDRALLYFDELTATVKARQEKLKTLRDVEQLVPEVPEYHLAEI